MGRHHDYNEKKKSPNQLFEKSNKTAHLSLDRPKKNERENFLAISNGGGGQWDQLYKFKKYNGVVL
jgi:hypothetical protein